MMNKHVLPILLLSALTACHQQTQSTPAQPSPAADAPTSHVDPQTDSTHTPTILALGDSITLCGQEYVGYRQVLIPQLRQKSVACQFIGPRNDAVSAHAGYGGKNTNYLLGISKEVYRRYPADIVLIHSGHNSFSQDKPVPGIVRDTEAIIDNFREINPNVIILLAQVIPSGKLPKYSYIPELNMELASLAARLNKRD